MPPKSQSGPTKFIRWFSVEGFVAFTVIIVSIIIAALSFFDIISFNAEKLLAVNAAVVSVLAALSLANSIKLVNQERALKELAEQSKRKDLATLVLKQRQQRPDLEEFVIGAKRVLICDAFLSSIRIEQYLLVQLIQSQCDIAIAVLNPKDDKLLAEMSTLSALEPIDNLRHLLEAAINNFALVSQLYIASNSPNGNVTGSLKLGYCNRFMPFAGVLVETRDQNDRVLIELYPFKYDELKVHRHHFILERKNTPELFTTYKTTLELVFASSEMQKLEVQSDQQQQQTLHAPQQ